MASDGSNCAGPMSRRSDACAARVLVVPANTATNPMVVGATGEGQRPLNSSPAPFVSELNTSPGSRPPAALTITAVETTTATTPMAARTQLGSLAVRKATTPQNRPMPISAHRQEATSKILRAWAAAIADRSTTGTRLLGAVRIMLPPLGASGGRTPPRSARRWMRPEVVEACWAGWKCERRSASTASPNRRGVAAGPGNGHR